MAASTSSPVTVLRFSLKTLSEASLVTKEMNSETHSCTVSLASRDTLALGGSDLFMMREMLAVPIVRAHVSARRCTAGACAPMGRNLSCSRTSSPLPLAAAI